MSTDTQDLPGLDELRRRCEAEDEEAEYWRLAAVFAMKRLSLDWEPLPGREPWRRALYRLEGRAHVVPLYQLRENGQADALPLDEGRELADGELRIALRAFEELSETTEEELEMATTATKKAGKGKKENSGDVMVASKKKGVPPSATSTSLPDGIARMDPNAADGPVETPTKAEHVETIDVEVRQLKKSPYQTREPARKEWLKELGESLLQDGQVNDLIVRRVAFDFEIIGGHTRAEAARLVGLKTLRCKVLECDDLTAARLVFLDNDKREDLSPIEEARGLKLLADQYAAAGKGQRQLAADIGVSQGQISNLTRLLELPEEWQARLISGEITLSAARELIPYCRHKVIADGLSQAFKDADEEDRDYAFKAGIGEEIRDVIHAVGRPLRGHYYDEKARRGRSVDLNPTPEQEAALQLVTPPRSKWDHVAPQPRALNVELWETLQAEAEAKSRKREAKKLEKGATGSKGKAGKGAAAAEPTAAELERKQEEQAKQLAQRVAKWKLRLQLNHLAHEWIPEATPLELVGVLLWFSMSPHHSHTGRFAGGLMEVLDEIAPAKKRGEGTFAPVARFMALGANGETDGGAMSGLAAAIGKSIEGELCPYGTVCPAFVEGLWEQSGLKLEDVWEAAGRDVYAEFLELHTKDQLIHLFKEFGYKPAEPEKESKGKLVEILLDWDLKLTCPKSLLKASAKDVHCW